MSVSDVVELSGVFALQAMDDPLLLAALTPLGAVLRPSAMRWSLCATDRCFKNAWMGAFFRAGQASISVRLRPAPGRLMNISIGLNICLQDLSLMDV